MDTMARSLYRCLPIKIQNSKIKNTSQKSKFFERVYAIVKQIPYGKVVSYGQVALYLGVPRAARQVGWALNRSGHEVDIPWWRVVSNAGRVSIKGSEYSAQEQRELLIGENILVKSDLTLDIKKYRFRPGIEFAKKLNLPFDCLDT